ncbi:FadR/GntR family transcriptional regulator [Gilvimarinus japonicus]|jgi:DNA-binding FadR family transcriptional regulator|uniref:FadR/GntR family transcriptional regulator n=1 Tax=Gilvimarinus japonicus TaxID=1796469 RepID=A0ABV7HN12_9GAMM
MNNFDGNRNLTHQVAYELGTAIVQGKYRVGDAFPTEAEMCTQYDISRSVIREAVKMLTAKGLISSRPRQGIRVLPSTQWNIFDTDVLSWTLSGRPSLGLLLEFTELRSGIEPEASALAARRQNREAIAGIEEALARLKLADIGEDDPLEADIAFHTAILMASNNRFYIQLRSFIQAALRVSIACTNQIKGVKAGSYDDHKRVYDAIDRGDAPAAQAHMSALLGEALELIQASIGARTSTDGQLPSLG